MRIILILLSAGVVVAFANAQRKSNFTKPIVNLDKRPRPPVWNRPPEERRKLSIFPRANMKFVVTPKPVVKNEDEKETLPTKRPVMRKFVMQDKHDKGTWSFAPREPLMKSQRFTVTLAPPKIDNENAFDEVKADESKKIKTVVENPKPASESNKRYNLNKGNLIEIVQIKKDDPAASKGLENFGQNIVEEKISEFVNDTHSFVDIKKIDSKALPISDVDSKDYVIDERSSNDGDIILIANETKPENNNYFVSLITNQTTITPDTEANSKDLKESRVLDVNDTDPFKYQYGSNNIIANHKETNNDKIEHSQSFSDVEILLKNKVNKTEENTNFNVNDSLSTTKNKTKEVIEDIPQFDDSEPKEYYDVISLSNNTEQENIKKEGLVSISVQGSQNIFNDDLQIDQNFTGNAIDSRIVSNLENLMQLIEEEALDMKPDEIYLDNMEARKQIESFMGNRSEIDIDTVEDNTEEPTTSNPIKNDVTNNFMGNSSEELESEESGELSPVFIDINSEESFENKSVSSAEISNVSLVDEDTKDASNESRIGYSNLTSEEIYSESNNMTDEDVSNESIREASINYSGQLSNESLLDKNNSFGEEVLNDSSSNMAGEELSNESIVDKSNNLTEETSSESLNETSKNISREDNESDVSDEWLSISNESLVGSHISREDNESDVSDEWLSISNESHVGSQSMSAEEISEEALSNRFKRSINIIEEENLATTISAYKYKGQGTGLNHDLSYKNINA